MLNPLPALSLAMMLAPSAPPAEPLRFNKLASCLEYSQIEPQAKRDSDPLLFKQKRKRVKFRCD